MYGRMTTSTMVGVFPTAVDVDVDLGPRDLEEADGLRLVGVRRILVDTLHHVSYACLDL